MPRRHDKQTRKYKPRNEFRHNNSASAQGHYDYIFGETDTHYKSIGLTHSPDGKYKYYALTENPNPNDKRKSYLRLKVRSTNKKFFKSPKKGWKFARVDMPVVRRQIKQYKKSTNRQPKNWYINKRKKNRQTVDK